MNMENLKHPITIRNRLIGNSELKHIRDLVDTHWHKGRTAISHILCEAWDWRQSNGQIKGMACRDMLLRLERMNYIQLPAPKFRTVNRINISPLKDQYTISHASALTGRIDSYRKIDIELARTKDKRKLWDSLVHNYHYLACKPIVGACLMYLIYLDDQLACCIGWGSAAWKVACRDNLIEWTSDQRKSNLNGIANNVRFLILPWVRVEHFASKILSLSSRQLASDWKQIYKEDLALLETFVDSSRFKGTCYRAANWRYLGQTKGSAKKGASYHHHGIIKSVFVYPLKPDFQKRLCR